MSDHGARSFARLEKPVFVGFSGGLDSTVLLHLLVQSRPDLDPVALHVNHRLQPEAEVWDAHCAQVAGALGIRYVSHAVDVLIEGGLEASARRARYRVFQDVLDGAGGSLLLAHHREDQVETVLLRLLQGRGCYGMPAERPLSAGRLLRPLIRIPQRMLVDYAHAQQLRWIEDPSNHDPSVDRSYLRQQVLPMLRARWPRVDRMLLDAHEQQRHQEALLQGAADALVSGPTVRVAGLLSEPPALQQALLRLWLQRLGLEVPSRIALAEFLRQLASGAARQPELRLARGWLRRFDGQIHHHLPSPALAAEYPITAPGRLALPHGMLEVVPARVGFQAQGALRVVFRRGGERMRVAGHDRTLKQILQQARVPPWLRGSYPLLADDHGLLAVPGIAIRDSLSDRNLSGRESVGRSAAGGGQGASVSRHAAIWRPGVARPGPA